MANNTPPIYLKDDMPCADYKRIPRNERTTIHAGQRKLLMCEMDVLNKYDCDVVVYAGSSPGSHITLLSRLFKHIEFILYDTVTPSKLLRNEIDRVENVSFFKRRFNKDVAKDIFHISKYHNRRVIFFSDIRTSNIKRHTLEETEKRIANDMKMQMKWVKIMRPCVSLLKFRLPWTDGTTEYFDGDIYLPVWGPQTTTECRLCVTDPTSSKVYNNKKYEQQMFYFNTVVRYTEYNEAEYSYDDFRENMILGDYIAKNEGFLNDVYLENTYTSILSPRNEHKDNEGASTNNHYDKEDKLTIFKELIDIFV